jgi:hypothetical protein
MLKKENQPLILTFSPGGEKGSGLLSLEGED